MTKTYTGYFVEDGRFVENGAIVKIPVRQLTIVNVMQDKVIDETKTKSQKQKEALAKLYTDLKNIDNEPFDDAFDKIINEGFSLGRELDL